MYTQFDYAKIPIPSISDEARLDERNHKTQILIYPR